MIIYKKNTFPKTAISKLGKVTLLPDAQILMQYTHTYMNTHTKHEKARKHDASKVTK
jgi:hypothetical protein